MKVCCEAPRETNAHNATTREAKCKASAPVHPLSPLRVTETGLQDADICALLRASALRERAVQCAPPVRLPAVATVATTGSAEVICILYDSR